MGLCGNFTDFSSVAKNVSLPFINRWFTFVSRLFHVVSLLNNGNNQAGKINDDDDVPQRGGVVWGGGEGEEGLGGWGRRRFRWSVKENHQCSNTV